MCISYEGVEGRVTIVRGCYSLEKAVTKGVAWGKICVMA